VANNIGPPFERAESKSERVRPAAYVSVHSRGEEVDPSLSRKLFRQRTSSSPQPSLPGPRNNLARSPVTNLSYAKRDKVRCEVRTQVAKGVTLTTMRRHTRARVSRLVLIVVGILVVVALMVSMLPPP
jgi:hypothetical protein